MIPFGVGLDVIDLEARLVEAHVELRVFDGERRVDAFAGRASEIVKPVDFLPRVSYFHGGLAHPRRAPPQPAPP